MLNRTKTLLFTAFAMLAMATGVNAATDIRITKTPKNSTIMPLLYKTVELLPAYAAKEGINDLQITLVETTNANTANDGLLLGRIDIVVGGINGFVPLYDKDPNKVRLISGWETFDNWLICTDPSIKSLKDIKPEHKISVKGLNAGEHLALRGYLAAELGADQTEKLNDNLVVLSRDDTFKLMVAEQPKIACGLIGSPWQNNVVEMGKAHVVSKPDGKKSFGFPNVVYATKSWLDANPKLARAFLAAQKEAIRQYYADPKDSVDYYIKSDKVDDVTVDSVIKMKKENNDVYDTTLKPALATMKFMYDVGLFKGEAGKAPVDQIVADPKAVKTN